MIKVRDAITQDAARLVEIYGYYVENTAISFEYETPDVEEFSARIASYSSAYPYILLEEDGQIMGYAYASSFHPREAYSRCCEVSIYVDCQTRKKGYGRILYEELEERLRKMGFLNLYACIADPIEEDQYLNRNSEQFHEHLGYRKIGEFHKCGYKFDRWYNMIWMEKIIGEHL